MGQNSMARNSRALRAARLPQEEKKKPLPPRALLSSTKWRPTIKAGGLGGRVSASSEASAACFSLERALKKKAEKFVARTGFPA